MYIIDVLNSNMTSSLGLTSGFWCQFLMSQTWLSW